MPLIKSKKEVKWAEQFDKLNQEWLSKSQEI